MAWSYADLDAVHLELSSRCNAACPGCPRFSRNSPNVVSDLVLRDTTFEEFSSWFSPDSLAKIKNWIICGTHGDPITCKDLVEIIEYICAHSPGAIQINTNGGLRGTKFFTRLGTVLAEASAKDGVRREVVFSLDGLEDTNHIYRRQVIWEKAFANLQAYAATGAHAAWDFLRFYHNNHQVDEARSIAESLGVDFRLKNPFGVENWGMPALNKKGRLDYVIWHHERPGRETYIPTEDWTPDFPKIEPNRKGCIECNSFRSHQPPNHHANMTEIYVDHQGRVLPCCFIGNNMYGFANSPEHLEVRKIQEQIGNGNSLRHHNLQEILDGPALKVYSDSWESKTINKCWLQCGKESADSVRPIDVLFVDGVEPKTS